MRIDQPPNTANLRLLSATAPVRQVAGGSIRSGVSTDTRRSMSDSFTPNGSGSVPTTERTRSTSPDIAEVANASIAMPSAATLAKQPRFAVLIELMERLTGREIKLLPPATMMFGARKQPEGISHASQPQLSGRAQITGVNPIDGGQVFRVATTATLEGGGVASTHFDIGMDMIQDHGNSRDSRPGPLRVHVSADAVVSQASEPLLLASGGADVVRVTPHDVRLDREA